MPGFIECGIFSNFNNSAFPTINCLPEEVHMGDRCTVIKQLYFFRNPSNVNLLPPPFNPIRWIEDTKAILFPVNIFGHIYQQNTIRWAGLFYSYKLNCLLGVSSSNFAWGCRRPFKCLDDERVCSHFQGVRIWFILNYPCPGRSRPKTRGYKDCSFHVLHTFQSRYLILVV